jgi:hypothetical protein
MGADGSSFLRSIGAGDVHMSERVDGWTTDENCRADGTDTSFFILVEIEIGDGAHDSVQHYIASIC